METGPFVKVEERQGGVWVILDRPPLNLIVPEMIEGVTAVFGALARDPSVRAAWSTPFESCTRSHWPEWSKANCSGRCGVAIPNRNGNGTDSTSPLQSRASERVAE